MAGASGLYPEHVDELIGGGSELVEQLCYDHDRALTHAGWRGRMRTCNGVGSGALTDEQVEEFVRPGTPTGCPSTVRDGGYRKSNGGFC